MSEIDTKKSGVPRARDVGGPASPVAEDASPTHANEARDARWETRRRALEAELGEAITVDGLTAAWNIFQRRRGHRHSTDDLLTGWYALTVLGDEIAAGRATSPTRVLDLGTGIGSVGLLVLAGLPATSHLVCVEAQAISFRFLGENIAANDLGARVSPRHGDLRDLALPERFPLVTGSPPYFDVRTGIVPADSQKAHARFELRGDVGDYARAAKRHLEPDGLFVFCFPFPQKQRALDLVTGEGLQVFRERDVVPRVGIAPLFSLFACRLATSRDGTPPPASATKQIEPPFVVRDESGAHAADLRAVRRHFGWPDA